MENVRKHRDIKLVTSGSKILELIKKPNFNGCKLFTKNLAAIEMKKTSVTMNKPIATGASILDIAKTTIYKFHYDYMKKTYGDKTKLC